jgi:16S rRNA (adenine1518-N6/adenine1519-N6)-dimethyltransferase
MSDATGAPVVGSAAGAAAATGAPVTESQLALLRRHGIRPVKRRGQNFLVDGNLARAIATEVVALGRRVLELGAGAGALTGHLLDLGATVRCVEVDRRLCAVLAAEFGDRPGCVLQADDLARLDWPATLQAAGPRPVVAGNLPYVLTSKVLFAVAEHREAVAGAVVMVQREVAERLLAATGGRDYGVLAVVMGSLFEIVLVRTVPPTVFWPRPEVDSAVVRLQPRGGWPEAEYRRFLPVVKALFQQRRKQLGAGLRRRYGLAEEQVARLAAEVGFDPAWRPEQLDPAGWRRLAAALPPEAAS